MGDENSFGDFSFKEDRTQGTSVPPIESDQGNGTEVELPTEGFDFSSDDPNLSDSSVDDAVSESAVGRPMGMALDQILESLNNLESMFAAKIDRSEYELETLKKQSEEIQGYKADLHASILMPVLKPLARMHSYMKRAISKAEAENADSVSLDEFEFAFDDLTEVIEDNGVEVRVFEDGCPFESNCMKITSQVDVADPEKNKTVNSASSDAYIFKNTVLEKARTVVNVYSNGQSS